MRVPWLTGPVAVRALRGHRALRSIAFCACLVLSSAITDQAAADPVAVSGEVDDGFGTIIFRWQSPVPFTINQDGTTVTVSFGRPVESANFAGALNALKGYLNGAQVSGDRSQIVLTLKQPFETSGFDAGDAVNVFFVGDPVGDAPVQAEAPQPNQAADTPASASAQPEAQATTEAESAPEQPAPPAQPADPVAETPLDNPQTATTTAAQAPSSQPPVPPAAPTVIEPSGPSIRIRTGLHEDYTRVVFDFTEVLEYQFRNDDGVVALQFDRPAQFDLSRFNNNPPRLVGGARASYDGSGVNVTFAVPATSEVRHFKSGDKVVLDIRNPSGTETPVALPVPAAQPTQAVAVAESQEPAESAPKPEPDQQQAAVEPETEPALEPDAATELEATAESASEPEAQEQEQAAIDTNAPISLAPPEEAEGVSGALGEYGQTPEALSDFQKNMAGASEARQAAEEAEEARRADAVALRFDWATPVGAAVFRRAGPLWVVFDQVTSVNTKALKEAAGNAIKSVQQVRSPRATVLRIDTLKGINPSLRRDGLAWILEFRKQELFANQSIEVVAQPDSPVGPRVFIPIAEPGEPVVIIDPDVGDTIVVLPVIPLSHGVNHVFNYPEVRVLKTAQGIAVKPWADDIRVRNLRQGVEVTSPEALNISEVAPELAANMALEVVKPLTRIFDLDEWRRGNPADYLKNRSLLYYDVSQASAGKDLQDKRLELARFYFANRFAPEALGVVKVMVQDDLELQNDPEIILMAGAANLLMGRYIDAAKFLAAPKLDGNDEAIFWRSILVAETGKLPLAAEELRRTGSIIRPYPRALKIPLGLHITEAAIELGDPKTATHYLEILNVETPTPGEQLDIKYVEGKLAEIQGNFDEAVTKWEEVVEGDNRWARARASVAKVELLMKLQRIDAREAVEELETLRFAWRGDDFEFNLLRRMGDLYLSIGDYRNGLGTLRQAATHFREHDQAPEVTRQMAEAFQSLYLDGEADRLAPVTAIALYDEFKELTPAGSRGDRMIQMLAERLVDADLLDRGANLLEAQVQFRLKDEDKARVGARLAFIYVMAKRYEDALDALQRTTFAGQTPETRDQRRLIRARALIGLKQTDEALAILEEDEGIDSYRLRSVVYWNNKDWRNASQALREVLQLLETRSNNPLSDEQQRYVLRLGIAMILSGNERGVARLTKDHGQAMMAGPLAEAFQLIARGPENGLIDYRTIAGKVGAVETFQTFLTSMKERLRQENAKAFN